MTWRELFARIEHELDTQFDARHRTYAVELFSSGLSDAEIQRRLLRLRAHDALLRPEMTRQLRCRLVEQFTERSLPEAPE